MTDKLVLTTGEKCYFDSFAGLIKCKAIKLHNNPVWNITVKITAKNNRVYKHGEIITTNTLNVIPRRCYHQTGIQRYVVYPDYIWKG